MKLLFQAALYFGLLFLIACGSDTTEPPGPAPAAPSGQISATLQESTTEGVLIDTSWSLPNVTAVMQNGKLRVEAINQNTGESLRINLPDSTVGMYSNSGDDPENGYAEYVRDNTDQTIYSSIEYGSNTPVFSVSITSVDTTFKEVRGSFIISCVNPNNDSLVAYFTDGSFTEVPYTVEAPDEEEEPDPTEPEGDFGAVFNENTPSGTSTDPEWTLPEVSAVLSSDQSIITATDPATGETLEIFFPSNQTGLYNNSENDPTEGFAEYTPSTGAAAYSSLNFENAGESALFFLSVDFINEDTQTMSGSFQIATYSEDGLSSAIFSSGSFTDIPFTGDTEPGDGGGGGGGNEDSFSALIDGADFETQSLVAVETSGNILITATSSSGNSLVINFSSSAMAGNSFELTAGSANTGTYQTSAFQTYTATSGSIDITTHDTDANVVSGTFTFVATEFLGTNTISVTEGSFEVTY